MAKQLQLRRGTTVQHSTFTGAVGEVTIDTNKDVVVVHDGATAGGFPSQKELVSGTNIKTINDTSILGSGNISVIQTISVTNIDEVKDFVAPYNNYTLNVLGALEVNDGGGGTFYYDESSTETANDIDIIEPTSGIGRWIKLVTFKNSSSRNIYTATSGQTSFASTYDIGYVDVYLNGVKLQPIVDFTATNGTSIVLTSGANVGDIVDIVAYGTFEVADTYTQSDTKANFAYKVSSIEGLASLDGTTPTVIVTDLDRGGTFIWSSTGTANDGTVFAGATGYWNRQYSGAVNVKWFNAVGDGVTDDTAAIQNAVISLSNGDTLFIPNGTYLISSSISFTTYGNTIFGTKLSILKATTSFSNGVLNFTDVGEIIIRDLCIQTLGFNTIGVYFRSTISCSNVLIDNVEFYSGGFSPVYFGSTALMIENFRVQNCTFIGNSSHCDAISINFGTYNADNSVTPLSVTNNTFTYYDNALGTYGTGTLIGTIFSDNVVLKSLSYGLYFYHNYDGIVMNNIFNDYVGPVWIDNYVNVQNNTFKNSAGDGVILYNGNYTFSDNLVTGCAGDGVILSVGSNYGAIQNNNIKLNSGNGIRVSAEPRGSSWTGSSIIYSANIISNTIVDNGKNGILLDDINKDGTYGNNINEVSIINNVIGDNGTSDTSSLNIYSGIKFEYKHTTLISTAKITIKNNNITDTYSQYIGTGNQYNAILLTGPNSGATLDIEVSNNTLLANSAGKWFLDFRQYSNRTILNNTVNGGYGIQDFGTINCFNNSVFNSGQVYGKVINTRANITTGYGTAAPTTGQWDRGSIVYNVSPSAGGVIGWVCTTAGTPGTWKTFGTISA